MNVTIVLGPPGAGKSTYVEAHARPGDVIVDFDKIAKSFGAVLDHDVPSGIGSVVFAARQAAIARLFDSLTGVKDPLDVDGWVIQWNLDKATIADWRVKGCEFVVVDPGEEETFARLEAEGRPQSSFDAARAWYENPPVIDSEKGARVRTKQFQVDVKAVDADLLAEGEFFGYAAVFDNVDSYGDVIRKGAFAETLGTDGSGIPCYWGHRMDDPMMNIGQTVSAVEDDHGLKVHVRLDTDTPQGAQVHKLIKQGRVTQMSFAYDVLESGWVTVDGEEAFELRKLNIFEVSVVPIGANQATELLAVKQAVETPVRRAGGDDTETVEEPDEEPSGQVEAKTGEHIAHNLAAIEAAFFVTTRKESGE